MSHLPDPSPTHPEPWLRLHPIVFRDREAMSELRAATASNKGKLQGTAARGPFDAITERVASPTGVDFRAGEVGGISGLWCTPGAARPGAVLLHLHGGWFTWGTAHAFRNLVGQIASRVGVEAFVPDYRLAPEHRFPAAVEDARACYAALTREGERRVVVTGDSAGGGLALLLATSAQPRPTAVVALSPVTDLAMTGASWKSRAEADPSFTRSQVEGLVRGYLGGHDPADPQASPLYGDLKGQQAVRIHVGQDEVLLDDARRYGERAAVAGADVSVETWEGMAHGFVSGVGRLAAADAALESFCAFLARRIAS